jgi:hypothetical protein
VKDEDKLIREGLLALMCVGDLINVVYSTLGWDNGNQAAKNYNVVRKCPIKTVKEESIEVWLSKQNTRWYRTNYIGAYKGSLYAWDLSHRYDGLTYDERMDQIIEIIKSEDTKFYG